MIREGIAKIVNGEDLKEQDMMTAMTRSWMPGHARTDRRLYHGPADQGRKRGGSQRRASTPGLPS